MHPGRIHWIIAAICWFWGLSWCPIFLLGADLVSVKDFNGTWRLAEVRAGDDYLDDDRLDQMEFVARDGAYMFSYEGASNHGRFRILPEMNPAGIDWYEETGNDPNSWRLSIVRKDGDALVVCYGVPGGDRPDSFVPDKRNSWTRVVYRRNPETRTPPDCPLTILMMLESERQGALATVVEESLNRMIHGGVTRCLAAGCAGRDPWEFDAVVHLGNTEKTVPRQDWSRFQEAHIQGLPAVCLGIGMIPEGQQENWRKLWGGTLREGVGWTNIIDGPIRHGVTLGLVRSNVVEATLPVLVPRGPGIVPLWLAGTAPTTATNVVGWIHEARPYRVFAVTQPLDASTVSSVARAVWWGIGRLQSDGKPLAGFEKHVEPLREERKSAGGK